MKFLTADQLSNILEYICDKEDLNIRLSLADIEVRYITDCHIFNDTITEFYLIVTQKTSDSYFIGYDEIELNWKCYSFVYRPISGMEIANFLNSK